MSLVEPQTTQSPALPGEIVPAATLRGVTKLYGTFAALRNVSLTLPAGQCTVLLGENGAGKSTLLRLLAGLVHPTQGSVEVLGAAPQARRGRIAYMSHAPMLYDELTALENLKYFAALDGNARAMTPEEALHSVGLDPALPRPVAQYSQGMRQRASLARALQSGPQLLLLDEPFSNLDVAGAHGMVELLGSLLDGSAGGQRALVLTTHQAHLAEPIAHLTVTLRRGQVAGSEGR